MPWTKNIAFVSILLMLTKDDLQQMSKLLDDRLTIRLTPIEQMLNVHTKILNKHSQELRTLRRDQKIMLNLFDREQMFQKRRLTRVETHLNLPPLI